MDNQTRESGDDLKKTVKDDVQSIKQEFQSAKADVTEKAKEQAESGKDKAADTLDELSGAIDTMANSISEDEKLGLASYVHSASSHLASLATRLKETSLDELAQDAKDLARRQPTAFLLGSVVLGFGLSRFVKASAHASVDENADDEQEVTDGPGAFSGNAAPDSTGASW